MDSAPTQRMDGCMHVCVYGCFFSYPFSSFFSCHLSLAPNPLVPPSPLLSENKDEEKKKQRKGVPLLDISLLSCFFLLCCCCLFASRKGSNVRTWVFAFFFFSLFLFLSLSLWLVFRSLGKHERSLDVVKTRALPFLFCFVSIYLRKQKVTLSLFCLQLCSFFLRRHGSRNIKYQCQQERERGAGGTVP